MGKTTAALCVSWVLARDHNAKVLVLDLDVQNNLSDALAAELEGAEGNEKTVFHALSSGSLHPHRCVDWGDFTGGGNIDLLLGGEALSTFEEWGFAQEEPMSVLRSWIETHAGNYDYVVVDTPPHLGLATFNAYVASDLVTITTEPQLFSLKAIERVEGTLQYLKEQGFKDLDIRVLISKYNPQNKYHREFRKIIRDTFVGEVLASTVEKRVAVERLQVLMEDPDVRQKGILPYVFVAREILKIFGKGK